MFDISVITPTYNRATLIAAALDSVAAQTVLAQGRSIEVAIIDDGSTDNTRQVVKPYLDRFHEDAGPADAGESAAGPAAGGRLVMRYIALKKQGVVTARNTGIAQTTAPWIAFLDSDDYWHPRKLEAQLAGAQARPDVGLSHTSFRYVDEFGQIQDGGPQRLDNPCAGRCLEVLMNEFLVIFSSVLVRRSLVEAAAGSEPHGQPFDPRWTNAQDYDLVLRVARLGAFDYVPEALTYYRLHGAHGAMGNLKRAYGFHSRVQIDFARRYGGEMGIDEAEARRRAGVFLLGRAQAAFWRRQLPVVRDLCDLAGELEIRERGFDDLARKAARPAWMYRVKDALDRVLRRGRRA